MTVKIRKIAAEDYPAVHQLILEFAIFIQTPEKVSITVEQMTAEQESFNCLVAEAGGRIVGFATYFPAYYSRTGKAIYLDDLFILEAYRGRNIGSMLLEAVIETGRKWGCVKVRWQVSRWNEQAIEFYRKRGAVVDDTEMNCDLYLD
ncbi:MAG TPA: GNAT family N-acetyltransferase [Flavilitoribacter sp.]|nr:GNAT family N-acetyltransferase [Flavilitoribacter sp.]HMQ88313.1 GNAT family N-acetyltransferase [Flavilitoribacter sp.]